MPIDMTQVTAWVKQADVIFQTPIIKFAVLPLLKGLLPTLGVTPEQMRTLDEHYADLSAREADAIRRSRLDT